MRAHPFLLLLRHPPQPCLISRCCPLQAALKGRGLAWRDVTAMFDKEHPIEAQVFLLSDRSSVPTSSDYASSEELSSGEEDCQGGTWLRRRVASARRRRRKSLEATVDDAEFRRFLWDYGGYGELEPGMYSPGYTEWFVDKPHKFNRFSEADLFIHQEENMQEEALAVRLAGRECRHEKPLAWRPLLHLPCGAAHADGRCPALPRTALPCPAL